MNEKKWTKLIISTVEKKGVEVIEIDKSGKKHWKLVFKTFSGAVRKSPVSCTPSSENVVKKIASTVYNVAAVN